MSYHYPGLLEDIKKRAAADRKTILMPESMDHRTYQAAEAAVREGIADIIIIGSEEEIHTHKGDCDLTGVRFIDPAVSDRTKKYEDLFVELRKVKGLTHEQAAEIVRKDYAYFGCLMVKAGDADGMVSGACHSTADTLRPCLQIIKTKPGAKLVSTGFIMEVPDCAYGENGIFLFSDCVLEQNPDPEKLACIAVEAAETFRQIVGKEPRVAMLSHSTKGSAKHADVDKVVEATRIAKEMRPDLLLDGELQLDAAIIPEIGAQKAPGSLVAGKANVLVFPDIDAGNNAYKLVQRLAKANAIGPMCQGLAAPVNDMSRGASWQDIVGTIAVTVLQAQMG